ncbi:GIY-YIG nuclease family protein [candidate division TA06 bacterium]|nr:GIY-YIG nuclease family protein [candidate division TA06 bacterium]
MEHSPGSYYTGSTKDLAKRLNEHDNLLGANYTKKKHPVRLVYYEEYPRIDTAFYREKQVQGWNHAKKKALIEGKKNKLPLLAKNYTQFGKYEEPVVSTSSTTGDDV